MDVSGVSGSNSTFIPFESSQSSQRKQGFKALEQALQSDDLSGAQQAFALLQPNSSAPLNATSDTTLCSGTQQINDPVTTDWNLLSQALQSGNIDAAQNAFSNFEQDLLSVQQNQGGQGVSGHHHHHHHHYQSVQDSQSTSTSTQSTSEKGSNINVIT